MKATIETKIGTFKIDLSQGIDLSMPLGTSPDQASAWYVDPVKITPVVMGEWIGEVKQGGSVNFRDIDFNPHGNGTHTECVGHISKEDYWINDSLKQFFFTAKVVSIQPQHLANGDSVFTKTQFQAHLIGENVDALIVRTLPNDQSKLTTQHSNTNWPYVEEEAALFLRESGIKHYLTDLPSVDREEDGGKLLSHHAFWNYPEDPILDATISEMLYIPEAVADGHYVLNLQIASFENDASPSKPVIYRSL